MDKCIRHSDGTMVTAGEWNNIKTSARMIRHELRRLPLPNDSRLKAKSKDTIKKSKTYYRTYHPTAWMDAIHKLEKMQPLLALCAPHWKADHVLGNSLLAALDNSVDDPSDEEPSKPPSPHKKQDKKKKKEKSKEKGKGKEKQDEKRDEDENARGKEKELGGNSNADAMSHFTLPSMFSSCAKSDLH